MAKLRHIVSFSRLSSQPGPAFLCHWPQSRAAETRARLHGPGPGAFPSRSGPSASPARGGVRDSRLCFLPRAGLRSRGRGQPPARPGEERGWPEGDRGAGHGLPAPAPAPSQAALALARSRRCFLTSCSETFYTSAGRCGTMRACVWARESRSKAGMAPFQAGEVPQPDPGQQRAPAAGLRPGKLAIFSKGTISSACKPASQPGPAQSLQMLTRGHISKSAFTEM